MTALTDELHDLCQRLPRSDALLVRRAIDEIKFMIETRKSGGDCDRCDEPAITEIDGDNLCQAHADAWCRSEAPQRREER